MKDFRNYFTSNFFSTCLSSLTLSSSLLENCKTEATCWFLNPLHVFVLYLVNVGKMAGISIHQTEYVCARKLQKTLLGIFSVALEAILMPGFVSQGLITSQRGNMAYLRE